MNLNNLANCTKATRSQDARTPVPACAHSSLTFILRSIHYRSAAHAHSCDLPPPLHPSTVTRTGASNLLFSSNSPSLTSSSHHQHHPSQDYRLFPGLAARLAGLGCRLPARLPMLVLGTANPKPALLAAAPRLGLAVLLAAALVPARLGLAALLGLTARRGLAFRLPTAADLASALAVPSALLTLPPSAVSAFAPVDPTPSPAPLPAAAPTFGVIDLPCAPPCASPASATPNSFAGKLLALVAPAMPLLPSFSLSSAFSLSSLLTSRSIASLSAFAFSTSSCPTFTALSAYIPLNVTRCSLAACVSRCISV